MAIQGGVNIHSTPGVAPGASGEDSLKAELGREAEQALENALRLPEGGVRMAADTTSDPESAVDAAQGGGGRRFRSGG
ncbi:MAG: hypothetical protein HQL51_14940 [Magnetococcales bacterium]|nr:hypothetical protein [Magnetococcales bacterium]